jgi:hypothetical protein
VTVAASVRYRTASVMSVTVEGRPHRRQALHFALRSVPVKRRVNGAGCDGVHVDAVFGVLHRQVLGDRSQTALGDHRHRRRDAPDRVASQSRRDRDDAPAGPCANICLMASWVTYRKPSRLVDTSDLKSSDV